MYMKVKKFLSILKVELEDLEADFEALVELYRNKEEKHLITEYVSKENVGLVKQEISALKVFLRDMADICINDVFDLDDLEKKVLAHYKAEIEKRGYPAALLFILERKVQKIKKYVLD